MTNENTLLTTAPLLGVATDCGAVGKLNEDAYGYFKLGPGNWEDDPAASVYVAIVADGVTSKPGGAQASKVAVDAIARQLQAKAPALGGARAGELRRAVDEAVHQANEEIRRLGRQNPELSSMSTTLVVAIIAQGELLVSHLGDSRAYLVRGNAIHRLTVDHTWIQDALDNGQISAADAKTHPNRNVIQRYLGIREQPDIDHRSVAPGTYDRGVRRTYVDTVPLEVGDIILLCSDGQVEKIADEEIRMVAASNAHQPQKAVEQLIGLALAQKEQDNITSLLLAMPGAKQVAGGPVWRTAALWGGGVAALILLVLTLTTLTQMRGRGLADVPAGTSIALAAAAPPAPTDTVLAEPAGSAGMGSNAGDVPAGSATAAQQLDLADVAAAISTNIDAATGTATEAAPTAAEEPVGTETGTVTGTGIVTAADALTGLITGTVTDHVADTVVDNALPTGVAAGNGTRAESGTTLTAGTNAAVVASSAAVLTVTLTAARAAMAPTTATAAATATMAPTQAPATATPRPSATPRPTNTATPRPQTATSTATEGAAETVVETATEAGPRPSEERTAEGTQPKVSDLDTMDEGTGRRRFRWTADRPLPQGATYAVTIWKKVGAERDIINNLTTSEASVSLDNLYTLGLIETGQYQWGVRLIGAGSSPQLLAQGADFEYQPQTKSNDKAGRDGTSGEGIR